MKKKHRRVPSGQITVGPGALMPDSDVRSFLKAHSFLVTRVEAPLT